MLFTIDVQAPDEHVSVHDALWIMPAGLKIHAVD